MSGISFHTDSGFATLKPSRFRELRRPTAAPLARPPPRREKVFPWRPCRSERGAQPKRRAATRRPGRAEHGRRRIPVSHERADTKDRRSIKSMQPKFFVLCDVCTCIRTGRCDTFVPPPVAINTYRRERRTAVRMALALLQHFCAAAVAASSAAAASTAAAAASAAAAAAAAAAVAAAAVCSTSCLQSTPAQICNDWRRWVCA